MNIFTQNLIENQVTLGEALAMLAHVPGKDRALAAMAAAPEARAVMLGAIRAARDYADTPWMRHTADRRAQQKAELAIDCWRKDHALKA